VVSILTSDDTVILEQSTETAQQQAANTNSRIISDVVLVVSLLVTIAAGWYVWREMNRVRPAVIRERRLAKKCVLQFPN
jgi:glutamine phosphoribosylpyrophosphate amidotransferase